jgi:hypothetical protein
MRRPSPRCEPHLPQRDRFDAAFDSTCKFLGIVRAEAGSDHWGADGLRSVDNLLRKAPPAPMPLFNQAPKSIPTSCPKCTPTS